MRRNRTLIDIIEDHERDIKRLRQALARVTVGAIDHGTLTGRADDDHPQYALLIYVDGLDHHTKYTDTDAAAKIAADDLYVKIAGDTMGGSLNFGGNSITALSSYTSSNPGSGSVVWAWEDDYWRARFGGTGTPLGIRIDNNDTIAITLARSGDITLTGVLRAGNGTTALPSHTFDSDPDMGMYRGAANDLRFSTGNDLALRLTGSRIYCYSSLQDTFSGASNVGMLSDGRLRRETSSAKTKDNITYPTHLADIVLPSPAMFRHLDSGDWSLGWIAEDMDAADSRLVIRDLEGEVDNYDLKAVVAIMSEQIKELQAQVKELQDA